MLSIETLPLAAYLGWSALTLLKLSANKQSNDIRERECKKLVDQYKVVYHFKRPKRDNLDILAICGFSLFGLVRVLWKHKSLIVWSDSFNWKSIIGRFKLALNDSITSTIEWFLYSKKVKQQKLNQRPIFILGSYRTGTTLLHHLLSANEKDFFFVDGLEMNMPNSCLVLRKYIDHISEIADRDTRFVDNVPYKITDPQEEQIGVAQLTGFGSILFLIFPRAYRQHLRELTLKVEEVGEYAVRLWKRSYLNLLKKATFARDSNFERRLVIKSPSNTCKIKLLLELFPEAQFIFLNRDPVHVFFSTCKLYETFIFLNDLTGVKDIEVQDFVLTQYKTIIAEYRASKHLIPKGNLVEIDFEELNKDKLKTLEKIFNSLRWDWLAAKSVYETLPLMKKPFVKNVYDKSSSDVIEMLEKELAKEITFYKSCHSPQVT